MDMTTFPRLCHMMVGGSLGTVFRELLGIDYKSGFTCSDCGPEPSEVVCEKFLFKEKEKEKVGSLSRIDIFDLFSITFKRKCS